MSGWTLELVSPPVLEPVTLDEVRDHLRITTTEEDASLDSLVLAARLAIEAEAGLSLLSQTRRLWLDGDWPACRRIDLPRPPLQSVTSVTYVDLEGTTQTLSPSLYRVIGARTVPDLHAPLGAIVEAYGETWPAVRPIPQSISVTYVAGWLARGAIPRPLVQALLVTIAELYEHRETTLVASAITETPVVRRLLASYRVRHQF